MRLGPVSGAVAAIGLFVACGGARPVATPPPPPAADAAPPDPIGPRASHEECERAFAHLVGLRAVDAEAIAAEERDRFVEDCATTAARRDIQCTLAARRLEELAACGGIP